VSLVPAFTQGRLQRVIVTRPVREAAKWVTDLQAAGWPAEALALIEVAEPQDAPSLALLAHWRERWPEMDALMFVSAAAVQYFFAGLQPTPAGAVSRTRFWAPGPGTARVLAAALKGHGVDACRIDAPPPDAVQFDSEALWPLVQPQLRAGQQLLLVRGRSSEVDPSSTLTLQNPAQPGHGREWLIRQCEAAGVQVQACVAYERRAPRFDAATRERAATATDARSLWIFSSSEALEHLSACVPGADWSQATALTTHPRIAQRAHEAGFGTVLQTRPALPDVLRILESSVSLP
jgi:uroporphyrinogen-III synthase